MTSNKPNTQKRPRKTISRANSSRCLFSTSDGRRCAMLRHESHPSLCLFHAREERQLLEAEKVAASLATFTGGLYTVNDVNQALAQLFRLVAANRIPSRTAGTLAYIGQLLLLSVPGVEREINMTRGRDGWQRLLSTVFNHKSGTNSGPLQ